MDNDGCILCNGEMESVIHVLWTCPAAQDVWGACDMRIQKCQSVGRDFQSIFAALAERCSLEEVEMCAMIARAIWNRRNPFMHGGGFQASKCIVEECSGKSKAVPIVADGEY